MINPNLDIACTSLAKKLLFTEGWSIDELLHTFHVQYRKGKSVYDIHTAIVKGIKAGNAKTEFEISMTACYLAKVVKLA